jgi:hypothetical protein
MRERAPTTDRASTLTVVFVIAIAMVVFRSAVWVFFEQSFFDSDQAIVGLMAKHLGEGRAFPLFFYGQHYMLGVEAFLVAPFFRVAGPSVATLKLPLVVMNVGVAWLLLWVLIRKLSMAPWLALLISSWFLLAPPLVSLRLVEAQGSNIEPLLYILVLWLLRERPIAFGLVAGVAFFHREFAAYGVAAVMILDVLTGRAFARRRLRDYAIAGGMFALVAFGIDALRGRADLLGPGTAGRVSSTMGAQVSSWGQFVCWPTRDLPANVAWLFAENLGTLFNWKTTVWGPQDWEPLRLGHAWIAILMMLIAMVAAFHVLRNRRQLRESGPFGTYLLLVGLEAAAAYAVLGCHVRDSTLVRYTLLTLYAPIGLLLLFAASKPPAWARAVVFGALGVWVAVSLADNARLLVAFVHHPPASHARNLVNYLETQGVKYARGPYWVAYELDFLSNERITVSSLDKVRVAEYQSIVNDHDGQALHILANPAWPANGCEELPSYGLWCLQFLDRARNVRTATSGGQLKR